MTASVCSCAMSLTGPKSSFIQDALSIGMHRVEDSAYPGLIMLFSPPPGPAAPAANTNTLTVFIEGDGARWEDSGFSPPTDPTPRRPLGLALAIQEIKIQIQDSTEHAQMPKGSVAYLSRPCQFFRGSPCTSNLWTDERYGDQAIESITAALMNLIATTNAQNLYIVGYSGGGVIASLLARNLDNIDCIVTLASPLDLTAWTNRLKISPLSSAKVLRLTTDQTSRVMFSHYIGELDRIVVHKDLGQYSIPSRQNSVAALPGVSHNDGWLQNWLDIRASSCLTIQSRKYKRGPHDNQR